MKQFFSISQYPGKTGQYFFTNFFKYYKIEATYNPIGSQNFKQTFDELYKISSGLSVSMPFKKESLKVLTEKDTDVDKYQVCNTIKIDGDKFIGFNCDLNGVIFTCEQINSTNICILGNGCIGQIYYNYLNKNAKIFSRSLGNWNSRHQDFEVVINCTSMGTACNESPLDYISEKTKQIIDLAIPDNSLQKQCAEKNIQYIKGIEFYKFQFLKQFEVYTGINADMNYFDYLHTRK